MPINIPDQWLWSGFILPIAVGLVYGIGRLLYYVGVSKIEEWNEDAERRDRQIDELKQDIRELKQNVNGGNGDLTD